MAIFSGVHLDERLVASAGQSFFMNEIEQAVKALRDAGHERAAREVADVVTRQYQRRGLTPWTPTKPLPAITIAETIRNWVQVFDIPIFYRGWQESGYHMLMGAFLIQPLP